MRSLLSSRKPDTGEICKNVTSHNFVYILEDIITLFIKIYVIHKGLIVSL